MKTFSQKKNFKKREYRIAESKVYCTVSKFGDLNEVDIPFESIDGDKVSFKSSNGALLFFSLLPLAVGFLTIFNGGLSNALGLVGFWFILSLILFIFYALTRENYWKIKLSNGSYLYFHKTIPNESDTNKFIDTLISERNLYLKSNYFVIDENLNYENQLSNFRWLKSINVISKTEFDNIYTELKKTIKPEKQNIGFSK